jgi:hypothetical protein
MAIHATGIAFMAFATVRIRVRMESVKPLSLRHVFAIMIGLIPSYSVSGAMMMLIDTAAEVESAKGRRPRRISRNGCEG